MHNLQPSTMYTGNIGFLSGISSLTCFLLLGASCAKLPDSKNGKALIPPHTVDIKLSTDKSHAAAIMYTGCGGMVIAHKGEGLMTDPFYTGQPFRHLPRKLKINPLQTHAVMDSIRKKLIEPAKIQSVLIAHAHYDHMLDLPYLLQSQILNDSIRILGNPSAFCNIRPFMNAKQEFESQTGQWISVSPHIRVMALHSSHAPHFMGFMLGKGESCPDGIPQLRNPESRSSGFAWKDGGTRSYLIDLLDEQAQVETRIFFQSSASQAPDGFPPAEVLKEKSVDMAFLCVASYDNVKKYPEAILEYLKPTNVVFIHWEDFFRKDYMNQPRIIRMNNTAKLMRRLEKAFKPGYYSRMQDMFLMPEPFTLIRLH